MGAYVSDGIANLNISPNTTIELPPAVPDQIVSCDDQGSGGGQGGGSGGGGGGSNGGGYGGGYGNGGGGAGGGGGDDGDDYNQGYNAVRWTHDETT